MNVGIIGLDTSHCVVFSELMNDASQEYHVPGVRVACAYPGGSQAFSLSHQRVPGYTNDLRSRFGVTICDSIADVVRAVDAVMLESVDGRQHLEQFRQIAVGKPVFIDKPFATSTADARAIIAVARETKTPIMSCSSLRYASGVADLNPAGEKVISCEAFGPAQILPDYPGLHWYGVHSAEMLFTHMGAGCASVRCVSTPDMDVAVGQWADGRIGVLRGMRVGKYDFGCVLHTADATRLSLAVGKPPYYYLLLQQVVRFFETGVSPIPIEETFGIVAFLEAADTSKEQGGAEVALARL